LSVFARAAHDPGQFQQLRARFQAGLFDRVDIDREADAVFLREQLNHPSSLGELREVADGQNGGVSDPAEDVREAPTLRVADKENLGIEGGFDI
jgi:hypothetical protein